MLRCAVISFAHPILGGLTPLMSLCGCLRFSSNVGCRNEPVGSIPNNVSEEFALLSCHKGTYFVHLFDARTLFSCDGLFPAYAQIRWRNVRLLVEFLIRYMWIERMFDFFLSDAVEDALYCNTQITTLKMTTHT